MYDVMSGELHMFLKGWWYSHVRDTDRAMCGLRGLRGGVNCGLKGV